eukprot:COSAG01_NODE_1703_length_9435_cov_206.313410_2_plen_122_part_00
MGEQRCGDDGVTAAAAGAVPFGGEACGSSVQAAGLAWLAPPTVCALGPTVNGRVGITISFAIYLMVSDDDDHEHHILLSSSAPPSHHFTTYTARIDSSYQSITAAAIIIITTPYSSRQVCA